MAVERRHGGTPTATADAVSPEIRHWSLIFWIPWRRMAESAETQGLEPAGSQAARQEKSGSAATSATASSQVGPPGSAISGLHGVRLWMPSSRRETAINNKKKKKKKKKKNFRLKNN
jgi:hypothetical protein